MKTEAKPGCKFYQVVLISIAGEEQLILITHTVSKITASDRIYFTSHPVSTLNPPGKIDNQHNRYLQPQQYSHIGQHDTPYKAADYFRECSERDVQAAKRKLDRAVIVLDTATKLALQFMTPDCQPKRTFVNGPHRHPKDTGAVHDA
jgi:hypothetical protein